jgi:hypothetical protein
VPDILLLSYCLILVPQMRWASSLFLFH